MGAEAVIVALGRPELDEAIVEESRRLLAACRPSHFGREAVGRALKEAGRPELFDPRFIDDLGPLASDGLLFPAPEPELALCFRAGQDAHALHFELEDGVELGRLLRQGAARGDSTAEELSALGLELAPTLGRPAPWPAAERPGLYRREHASLLIRSRTSAILLDPLAELEGALELSGVPRGMASDQLAAIAITHSHRDHWHLPSILAAAGAAEVPVLVPRLLRPNLLCTIDFEAELASVGQRAIGAAWGSTHLLGDIEVDVLPFRGEQPTRARPGPAPELRNQGNCYRFTTEDFSVVVMVDAGFEPDGSILEVLERSRRERGPPDVLLACLREFSGPFFSGLPYDWLTLERPTLSELSRRELEGGLPSVTAGPVGWAQACAVSKARAFLPYAHGFSGLGRPIVDSGWGLGEASEAALLGRLAAEVGRLGCGVELQSWNPGDAAFIGPRGLKIRSGA